MTDVTIRGIEDDVYAKFTAEAKKRDLSIGELTTIVMRALVEDIGTTNYRIGNLAVLLVSKRDLESLKGPVMFHNIKTLEFADDIDWDSFDRSVMSIKNCAKVLIPQSLTRFQVLTKCAMVAEVRTKNER
jgi:putative transposon-encoded protein